MSTETERTHMSTFEDWMARVGRSAECRDRTRPLPSPIRPTAGQARGKNVTIPTIDHPTDRPNFTQVELDGVTMWFSYRTLIAFNAYDGPGLIVHENVWGPTTGKHLNYIDDGNKATRLSAEAFQAALTKAGL